MNTDPIEEHQPFIDYICQNQQRLKFKQNLHNCECAKILIVDDEAFNIIALEGLLHQLKITKVDRAFNGKEALKKI